MWFSYWSAVSYIYIVAPCIALSVALHTVCHLHVLKCIWITVYNLGGQATLTNTQNDSSMQWYPALYPKALPSANIGLRYTLRLHAGTYLLFHRGGAMSLAEVENMAYSIIYAYTIIYWCACTSQCMHARRIHAKLTGRVIVRVIRIWKPLHSHH